MKANARMWPFVKSVLFGALAGSAPLRVLTETLVVTSLPVARTVTVSLRGCFGSLFSQWSWRWP